MEAVAVVSAAPYLRREVTIDGMCERCERGRPVFIAARHDGGTHRRPRLRRIGMLCRECVTELASELRPPYSVERWMPDAIVRIVRSLYLPTTPEEAARA